MQSLSRITARARKQWLFILVLLIGFLLLQQPKADAVRYSPPYAPPAAGAPPPTGSGDAPPPVASGDAGAPRPAPTGFAHSVPIHGTYFGHQAVGVRSRADLQNGPGQTQWPAWVQGPPMTRRIQTPTGEILEQVPRKYIDADGVAQRNHPLWFAHESENAPLPTVKIFARLVVIAGCVFATVFMIFAAFGVVLGHRDAGQRVISTAVGLMLLFMGYSIYKIIMINAYRFDSDDSVVITRRPVYQREQRQPANTPVTPAGPGAGAARSNLPVVPFRNAGNP